MLALGSIGSMDMGRTYGDYKGSAPRAADAARYARARKNTTKVKAAERRGP